ncbi:MAG: T9SS C-terminal target domain-containing protein [Bacteroidota bacterium]
MIRPLLRTLSCLLLLGSTYAIGAQNMSIKNFIFGHSLLDHRPPAIPTPSDETTVPHWLYLLAEAAGHDYSVAGQYGFLPQHANLPPFSQWGYDLVPPAWESDLEPFSAADFSTILLTAGNFMQWQGPAEPYPGEDGVLSPITATEAIVDWVRQEEDTVAVYIYENWPDMAPYLNGNFPPEVSAFANYNDYTRGAFHDWWIDYQDALLAARPAARIRMIPVGPIIADLLSVAPLNSIPLGELYEDDAPHGRASLYFLASLVTYMAIYAEEAPANFVPPAIVHELITNNYAQLVGEIWAALLAFNTDENDSRVFFSTPTSTATSAIHSAEEWRVFPNPVGEYFTLLGPEEISGPLELSLLDIHGRLLWQNQVIAVDRNLIKREAAWTAGRYSLKIRDRNGREVYKTLIFQ